MSDKYPTAGLKPCPFCGQDVHPDYDAPRYVIHQTNKKGCSHGRIFMDRYGWNARPIEDALNARIAELEAAQRWIPVSERLPEIGVRVLFYNNFIKNIHKGWYSGDEWVSEIGVFYNGDKLIRITHWMPLPQPPEVQE